MKSRFILIWIESVKLIFMKKKRSYDNMIFLQKIIDNMTCNNFIILICKQKTWFTELMKLILIWIESVKLIFVKKTHRKRSCDNVIFLQRIIDCMTCNHFIFLADRWEIWSSELAFMQICLLINIDMILDSIYKLNIYEICVSIS